MTVKVIQKDGYEAEEEWEVGSYANRDLARDMILSRISDYLKEFSDYRVCDDNPWRIENINDSGDFHEWIIV